MKSNLLTALGQWLPLRFLGEGRFWRYAFLPLAGSVLHRTLLFSLPSKSLFHFLVGVAVTAGRPLPVALMIRLLDRQPPAPLRLRLYWPALLASTGGFALAVALGRHRQMEDPHLGETVILVMAILAGFWAAVPLRECTTRVIGNPAAGFIALAGMLPYGGQVFIPWLWRRFPGIQIRPIHWLLEWLGVTTQATPVIEPHFGCAILIRSDAWELFIAQGCSTFIMLVPFLALFASMLLLDERRVALWRKALLGFAAGVAALIAGDVFRLAALFYYGHRLMRRLGHTQEAFRLINAFHHAGGGWLWDANWLGIALYLYGLACWLDRKSAVR